MPKFVKLVQRAQSGDVEAFGQLVRDFQDMAYGYALSVLGDFSAAEDATQDAFVEAFQRLGDLREPLAFPAWLRKVVYKHCDRRFRRKGLEVVPIDESRTAGTSSPARDVEHRELQRKVLDAIATLTQKQRTTVTLFYMNGYTEQEVSDFLEVPVSTVKKRLHDARQNLKERMIDMVDDTLKKNALSPEFHKVVEERCATRTSWPALMWFRGEWVMIWQDGRRGEKWDGPYWFMVATSRDGAEWSAPRRLEVPDGQQCLPDVCVWQEQLCMLAHSYHEGYRLLMSSDLNEWDESRLMLGDTGRAGLFVEDEYLYLTYAHWCENHSLGDSVELLRSSDGRSWEWLPPPVPQRGHGINDACGVAVGKRLHLVSRELDYADEPLKLVKSSYSDDNGSTWSAPTQVDCLQTREFTRRLAVALSPAGRLVAVQSIILKFNEVEEKAWGYAREAKLQVAVSDDGGTTWRLHDEYDMGAVSDPTIAFAPDGTALFAANSPTAKGSIPGVVKLDLAQ